MSLLEYQSRLAYHQLYMQVHDYSLWPYWVYALGSLFKGHCLAPAGVQLRMSVEDDPHGCYTH